ncbi:MAG TPA: pyridoxamine 5'-phosphate oxidase family protein [Blastocatellia bacterium]|nr:pyridoxamine 5'-phosphate oxidase family protein [Blastocatellia bacterium]
MAITILNQHDSVAFLRERAVGRLGCIIDGAPYVVPVNYYFDGEDIYVHSLPGRKIEALRANPSACLQVDEIRDAYHWRSVIAYGRYEEITHEPQREQILAELFHRLPHLTPAEARQARGRGETVIFRLRVGEISGVRETW